MFNRKREPYTQDEIDYIFLVKSMGCVCCAQLPRLHRTNMVVEFNHHVRGNRRIGNIVGTGECVWHHRGEPHPGFQKRTMLLLHGPSRMYQGSKGAFAARWGTDEELLQRQEDMLNARA